MENFLPPPSPSQAGNFCPASESKLLPPSRLSPSPRFTSFGRPWAPNGWHYFGTFFVETEKKLFPCHVGHFTKTQVQMMKDEKHSLKFCKRACSITGGLPFGPSRLLAGVSPHQHPPHGIHVVLKCSRFSTKWSLLFDLLNLRTSCILPN